MFPPALLVTSSVAFPLPTANYPNKIVRVGSVYHSGLLARHTSIAIRHNNRAVRCPVHRLRKTPDGNFDIHYTDPNGYRLTRRRSSTSYLFLENAVILKRETLILLWLLMQPRVLMLPAPEPRPMLPAPKIAGLLPAPVSSFERRMTKLDREVRQAILKTIATSAQPELIPLFPKNGSECPVERQTLKTYTLPHKTTEKAVESRPVPILPLFP